MSKPDNNWEVHWQETLDKHEATPPSATDWGGMEQLLDAKVVSIQPEAAAGSFPTPSLIPWSVWAIALVSLLALGYWLGTRSAVSIGQEELALPNKQVSADIISTVPSSNTTINTPLVPDTNSEQANESLSVKQLNTKASESAPGPAINTPNIVGGRLDDAPPATLSLVEKDTSAKLTPTPAPVEGIGRSEEEDIAPAFSPPNPTEQRIRPKYRSIRPLPPLAIPTYDDRWEQRVGELSERLVIVPPSKITNGHFPAYRIWN